MTTDKFPRYVKKSVFARILGITPSAIGNAIQVGAVVHNHDNLIDLENHKNKRYAKECAARKRLTEKGKQEEIRKRNIARLKSQSPDPEEQSEPDVIFKKPGRPKKSVYEKETPKPTKSQHELIADFNAEQDAADQYKADYQIAKLIEQTKSLQIKNAATLKMLIDRKFVDQVIGRIASVLSNHLLTMGDRLAADCAAECGALTPENKIAVKQIIDKDVTRSINALKSEIQKKYEEQVEHDGS